MASDPQSRGYVVKAGASRRPAVPQPGRFLATSEDTQGAFMVVEAAGGAIGPSALHVHHDHDEAMYIIEGNVIATIGEVEHHLGPGDFAFLPKGVPHRLDFRTEAKWPLIGTGGYDDSRGRIFAAFSEGHRGADAYAVLKDVDFVAE
jgi:mannose-6-phosphate isomerase-like protein (cupin superfamily)